MQALWQNLFGKSPAPFPPLAPEEPLIAVGDIHGRYDLLLRLFEQLAKRPNITRLVFLGDYIDRGENSAEVLKALSWLQSESDEVVCLRGNHEEMLLNVLDDPVTHGPTWMRHGGKQTLASYGIQPLHPESTDSEWLALARRLEDALGGALVEWLSNLPASWRSGNIALMHAGADPSRSISDQEDSNLVWGHRNFQRNARKDGVWVIHGHTIFQDVTVKSGRIAVDTGAYATGVLSAVCVNHDFLEVVATNQENMREIAL